MARHDDCIGSEAAFVEAWRIGFKLAQRRVVGSGTIVAALTPKR